MYLSYPNSFHGLISGKFSPRKELLEEPLKQVNKRFWSWDDIERNGNCSSIFKVRHPQFCPSKFPFCVCLFLLFLFRCQMQLFDASSSWLMKGMTKMKREREDSMRKERQNLWEEDQRVKINKKIPEEETNTENDSLSPSSSLAWRSRKCRERQGGDKVKHGKKEDGKTGRNKMMKRTQEKEKRYRGILWGRLIRRMSPNESCWSCLILSVMRVKVES